MGKIFGLTDFMSPSISLLHEFTDSEQKAIFTILLNSNLKHSLSFFKQKLSCASQPNTARPKVKAQVGQALESTH